MARQRVVYANRAILANDLNQINANLLYNMEIINKDLLGLSEGVVNGLDENHSGLDITISSGIITKDGTFYELLEDDTITASSSSGTYYVYATYTSTNDTPVTGYVLLNPVTRTEAFSVVNTRTYDSITLAIGASVPVNALELYEVVVSGGSITSVTDSRQYTDFGNIVAYSLQYFSENNKNTITRTNKISGELLNDTDSSHNIFMDIEINNAHAGYGINIDTGTNVGAKGIIITTEDNIGIDLNVLGDAIGINIDANNQEPDNKSIYIESGRSTTIDNNYAILLDVKNYGYGLGVIHSDTELLSDGVDFVGINIDNTSGVNFVGVGVQVGSNTNDGLFLGIGITNVGTGLELTDIQSLGVTIDGIIDTGTIGANIEQFETGLIIDDTVTGIQITNVADTGISIDDIDASGTGILLTGNNTLASTDVSYGLRVINMIESISVEGYKLNGIQFSGGAYNPSGVIRGDIDLSKNPNNTVNEIPCHIMVSNASSTDLDTLPNTFNNPVLQFYYTGGSYKLAFHDGTNWNTLDMTAI